MCFYYIVFQRENSIDTVLLSERRRSAHWPGCSWEEPDMEGHPDHLEEDTEHMEEHFMEEDPDHIEHFEDEDPELGDCFDEEDLDSIDSSDEEDLHLIELSEEEDPDEIETPRPIPTHPFQSFTAVDIESDTSDTDSEGGMFPPGGHNDWEVRMLAAELDRRESMQRRKARLVRNASLGSRRRVASHTCQGRCGRKPSTEDSSESEVRSTGRRPPLVTAQSLDDQSGLRDTQPLSKRSMSFGNIQSTVSSSSSGRSFGALFPESKPQTSHESTTPDSARASDAVRASDASLTDACVSKNDPPPTDKSLQDPKL